MKALVCLLTIVFSFGVVSCTRSDFAYLPVAEASNRLVRGPYVTQVTHDTAILLFGFQRNTRSVSLRLRDEMRPANLAANQKDYRIELINLEPGAVHTYIIDFDGIEQEFSFKTVPVEPGPIRFVVYGDTRSQIQVHRSISEAIAAENVDFIVHTGDFTDDPFSRDMWTNQFFGPAAEMLRNAAIYPTIGNHEKRAADYFKLFALRHDSAYYSFSWGDVEFFVVDTHTAYSRGSDQWNWLSEQLSASTAKWKFVSQHVPGISSDRRGLNESINKALRPLYEQHAVDIVFAGHAHFYERTLPIAGEEGSPVTYIITGGGGAKLHPVSPERIWTAYAESVHHYILVEVDGDELKLSARGRNGRIIDEFTLRKDDAEYINQALSFEDMR